MVFDTPKLSERATLRWMIAPYIIAIIGVVAFTSYCVLSNVWHYNCCTESVMATVVSYTKEWYPGDSGASREEKVRYILTASYTVQGQTYVSQSRTGTVSPPYSIGSSIKVLYNPDDPGEFCLIDDVGPLTAYVLLAGVGTVIVVVVSVRSIFKIKKVLPTLSDDDQM